MADLFTFTNANSRDTYFTVHRLKKAHAFSLGSGVKIGIIDWLFGAASAKDLYADAVNFTEHPEHLYEHTGHGRWMADTLREIAPACRIYALNAVSYEGDTDEERDRLRSRQLAAAIDWACTNGLDILTYSHGQIPQPLRTEVDQAVERAHARGLLTTFIHNDHPLNLWPYPCMPFPEASGFMREPDLNLLHYDYRVLFPSMQERYQEMMDRGEHPRSGNDVPFFSVSSTSPVLAGICALLKSLDPALTPQAIKEKLQAASYAITDRGEHWYDLNPCPRVVDAGEAVERLLETRPRR